MNKKNVSVAEYVRNFHKRTLNNQEVYTLLFRLCLKLYNNAATELNGNKVLLYQKFNALHIAMYKLLGSLKTPDVVAADKRRDELITAMRHFLEYIIRMKNPTTLSAAERLLKLINQQAYKTTRSENFAEETARLSNLLDELRGNYAADVQTVNMGELVAELAAANAIFNNIYDQRSQEASVLKKQQSVSDARVDAETAFEALRQSLNSLQTCFENSQNGSISTDVPSIVQETVNAPTTNGGTPTSGGTPTGGTGGAGGMGGTSLSATYTDFSDLITAINLEIDTIMETAKARHKKEDAQSNSNPSQTSDNEENEGNENNGEQNNHTENSGEGDGENTNEENGEENTDPNQGDDNTPSANA